MKHRPFLGARIEDAINARVLAILRKRGWQQTIIPYTGYGNTEHIRVLGRLVLRPHARSPFGQYADRFLTQRGWRNFFTAPVPNATYRVQLGDEIADAQTDRSGYLDLAMKVTDPQPGWWTATVSTDEAEAVEAPVLIVGSDVTFGIVSDIDDTILSTFIPRILLAAWNTFVTTEGNRQAVEGMARLYQKLLAANPGAPIVYVSTGAWNTLPFLNRFLARHGFPRGPLLLTDWGPTQTSFFRSGREHKRYSMSELARDFPHIKWLLIGDNGQHDPALYREFAELQPDHVRAIAIRTLSSTEQVLAHGTPTELTHDDSIWSPPPVPAVDGDDGDELGEQLAGVLDLPDLVEPRTRRSRRRRGGSQPARNA